MLLHKTVIGCALLLWCIQTVTAYGQQTTLKDAAAPHGVTMGAMIVAHEQAGAAGTVVLNEYSLDTIGYYWPKIRPERNTFDWTNTDLRTNWALANNLKVHLHPLIYVLALPGNLPQWVHDADSSEIPTILEEHFDAIAGRYGNEAFDVIDVVNEALNANGTFRDSPYLDGFAGDGLDFLEFAFAEARERFPQATLLFNDFGAETIPYTAKFRETLLIFEQLQARGVPLDGYGWQMHVSADDVLADGFVERWSERMQQVTELGLGNHVTELDVTIADTSPAELEKQKQAYQLIAETFLDNATSETFTTWGFSDASTWLPGTHPLPFDENYAPKPAYTGLLDALNEAPASGDFDGDGDVDGADFLILQQGLNTPGATTLGEGDANGDGLVDSSDLAFWELQFGTVPLGSVLAVPEPYAGPLALVGWACFRTFFRIMLLP